MGCIVDKKIKVLVGKVGLDGHDRGVKVVAKALSNAGIDVVSPGLHRSPDEIVEAAVANNVDAISLSVHTGAHKVLFGRVLELLGETGRRDIAVFGGGIIPDEDEAELKAIGVKAVFRPGCTLDEVVAFVKGLKG